MSLEGAMTTFLVIAGLGLLIYLIVRLIRLRFVFVPEEERLVIYRVGRFNRVAGPGWIVLIGRWDSIHRRLLVRDQPVTSTALGIMIHGVTFGYTLNFWCRVDLILAAQEVGGVTSGRESLILNATLTDSERRQQIDIKVREALTNAVWQIQNEEPLLDRSDLAQALLPVLPGLPECDRLLAKLRTHLVRTLPTIGVLFDTRRPITVMAVHLGDDIIRSFSRNRIVTIMKERFPTMSEHDMIQALASIEGIAWPEIVTNGNVDSGIPSVATTEKVTDGKAKNRDTVMSPITDSFEYDVYISYAPGDKKWVRDQLIPWLEKHELKVLVDYLYFNIGAARISEIEYALEKSRKTLLVLSTSYLLSQWAGFEENMLMFLDVDSRKQRVLPVKLFPCELPARLRYLVNADLTDADGFEHDCQRLLKALGCRTAIRHMLSPPSYKDIHIQKNVS